MVSEQLEIHIPFHDVDSMEVVWHGHYIRYFELARCKLLEKIAYTYKDMAQSGYLFPIVDVQVKYLKPAVFMQDIIVSATIKEWHYRLKIEYVITDKKNGKELTKGYTIQAAVDQATQVMRLECPDILQTKIVDYADTQDVS